MEEVKFLDLSSWKRAAHQWATPDRISWKQETDFSFLKPLRFLRICAGNYPCLKPTLEFLYNWSVFTFFFFLKRVLLYVICANNIFKERWSESKPYLRRTQESMWMIADTFLETQHSRWGPGIHQPETFTLYSSRRAWAKTPESPDSWFRHR